MSKKKGDASGGKLATTIAMAGGVFLLRKLLALAWTKTTGKNPPTDINDPDLKLAELLAWSIATGIVVESARYAIAHAAARKAVEEGATE